MSILDDLRQEMTRDNDLVQSLKTLILAMRTQIEQAADMAAVAAVVAEWKTRDDELASWVAANTPAAPPAAPEPPAA